jgi:Tfp pilus assembly protein PilF
MSVAAEALKTPPPQRERFLHAACKNDPELYREVSDVVTWEERMGDFLSRPLIEFVDLETGPVFQPSQTLVYGRFEILRCVGEGGMGELYEAQDHKRNQRIAIKCAKPGFGRLLSPELEGALKVRHPNICVVNEIHSTPTAFGELDFITMEFLDGETLAARLARGKLAEPEAMDIACQLCAGVAEAHNSGILHRDLKPSNIILCHKKDGATRAVITDFGLATDSTVNDELHGGTPSYMAPELWRGEKASPASDVFSLGVILYEMVTGQKPFLNQSKNNGSARSPIPPSKRTKGLSRKWDKAILPCLAPNSQERCSAKEVQAALERKPVYLQPTGMLAMAACLILLVIAAPAMVHYFVPAHYRLAMFPVEAPANFKQQGDKILDDVARRVQEIQTGKPAISVIPSSVMLNKNVATTQQAEDVLGATHALQLQLRPETDGVRAVGAIIDLRTMAHVRDYSGYFPRSDLMDLPTELTGLVAWALHAQPVAIDPEAASAYNNGLKDLEQEPRNFTDAESEFNTATKLDPHSPLPLAGLAEAYGRQFQATHDVHAMDQAKLWLAKAETLAPDSLRVWLASGLLHQIQGEYAKALEDYKRVVEIDPGNVKGWLGCGLSHELLKMTFEATADYNRAIQADPDNYEPYVYLGAFHFFRGEYSQAEGPFNQAVEKASRRTDVYGSLAGVYIAQEKYREAEEVFSRAPKGPSTALLLNNFGAKLAFQRHYAEAAQYYRAAVTQDPGRAIYWLNLGDAQRRLRQNPKAAYQRGLSLAQAQLTVNAASVSTRAYLAYLEARLGLKPQARLDIDTAIRASAKDDQVVLCAVQTYEVLGDRNSALAAASQATAPTLQIMNRHPDLAGLQHDSRFTLLMGKTH